MSITAGTRFGPYEIVSALGAGGMGEVYPARDTKLNRDVAIKVLSEVFALDADRLARFTVDGKCRRRAVTNRGGAAMAANSTFLAADGTLVIRTSSSRRRMIRSWSC